MTRMSIVVLLPSLPAAALAAEPGVHAEWHLRLRHEHVYDDLFARPADATTLRLRAGWRWTGPAGLSALVEGEGVAAAGAFDSGAGARRDRPAVIDPAGVELNQLWLAWKGERGGATLGRQRLQLDNQRWVGNSGWRQNEQTFDALATQWMPHPQLDVRALRLARVHRASGDDARDPRARERALASDLLNVAWTHDAHRVAGYHYRHDDRDVPAASTATTGLRWTRGAPQGGGLAWTIEAARQRDHADNPLAFPHGYRLLEPAWTHGQTTLRVGFERLGGDGRHALQAPLGTLHAFNGWADRFLVTPADGLDDRYLAANGRFTPAALSRPLAWTVAWHDFRADRGGARYGRELDASVGIALHPRLDLLAKLADYRADGFSRDTRKLWLQLEWKP